MEPIPKKLLDQVRNVIRLNRYILFHNKLHPQEMGRQEIEVCSPHAVQRNVFFCEVRVSVSILYGAKGGSALRLMRRDFS